MTRLDSLPSRLDIDESGRRLVVGGPKGIDIFSLSSENTLNTIISLPGRLMFIARTVIPREIKWSSPYIYIISYKSNDLIQIKISGGEMVVMAAGYPDKEGASGSIKDGGISRFEGDNDKILWLRGDTCISGFSLTDQTIQNMKTFWKTSEVEEGDPEIDLLPMIAVADSRLSKFFGLGIDVEGLGGEKMGGYVCYYNEETEDIMHVPCTDFKKHIDHWKALEVSKDTSVVFVGGDKDNKAVIGALSFDSDIKILKFSQICPEQTPSLTSVTSLRRVANRDILMVGCHSLVAVYSYGGKDFQYSTSILYAPDWISV